MVQDSLNQYRETHNANPIRKQKGLDVPSGHSPNYMWENCTMFNVGKCCNAFRSIHQIHASAKYTYTQQW